VTGLSLSHEKFDFTGYSEYRNPNGWAFSGPQTYDGPDAYYPLMNLYDPNSLYTGPRNRTLTSKTSSEQDNTALYAFDTLRLTEHWQLSGGVRYEVNKAESIAYGVNVYTAPTAAAPNPTQPANVGTLTGTGTPTSATTHLFSWRAGLAYKPVENGTFYVSYGNSKTPSVATVNGTCVATSTTGMDPRSPDRGPDKSDRCARA